MLVLADEENYDNLMEAEEFEAELLLSYGIESNAFWAEQYELYVSGHTGVELRPTTIAIMTRSLN